MTAQISQYVNLQHEYSLVRGLIAERQRDLPLAHLEEEPLSQALIHIFSILDERYFELTSQNIELKESEHAQHLALSTTSDSLASLRAENFNAKEENSLLRAKITEYIAKIHESEERMESHSHQVTELNIKLAQHESQLSSHLAEISELNSKCEELEHAKSSLEDKIKETHVQQDILRYSLSKEIEEMDSVRERQNTKMNDVSLKADQYYTQIESITDQKNTLETEVLELEKQLTKFRTELGREQDLNKVSTLSNVELEQKNRELKERVEELELKCRQLDDIREEYTNLKDKESDFDIMIQTLSSEKKELDNQITRMTLDAKRKFSDNDSINTDKAIEHICESFGVHNVDDNPTKSLSEKQSLSRSSHDLTLRKISYKVEAGVLDIDNMELVETKQRLEELMSVNAKLEAEIQQLHRETEEQRNGKVCEYETMVTLPSPTKEDDEIILNRSNLCSSREDSKEMSVQKFQMVVRPQIRLFSLYSMQSTKILPRPKADSGIQTVILDRMESSQQTHRGQEGMRLEFDEIQIESGYQKKEDLGFFDRLAKMFCGGVSE